MIGRSFAEQTGPHCSSTIEPNASTKIFQFFSVLRVKMSLIKLCLSLFLPSTSHRRPACQPAFLRFTVSIILSSRETRTGGPLRARAQLERVRCAAGSHIRLPGAGSRSFISQTIAATGRRTGLLVERTAGSLRPVKLEGSHNRRYCCTSGGGGGAALVETTQINSNEQQGNKGGCGRARARKRHDCG